ncbi:hypothetical protein ACGFZP_37725 [Kitasatospora sp. NPDC048239]|uniref:hypothetical protein n=1 Tax=Kitasatospora sp. NPDC048239 TaxID=3364046 RepID=UPI00371F2B0F
MTRATGFLVDARTEALTDLLYDNRPPGTDPGLDRLTRQLGLRTPEQTLRSLPPPTARKGL